MSSMASADVVGWAAVAQIAGTENALCAHRALFPHLLTFAHSIPCACSLLGFTLSFKAELKATNLEKWYLFPLHFQYQ